jgi:valyl-tRNA synthetase
MTETLTAQRRPSLPPQWQPAEVELALYQRWVDAGYFAADSGSEKPPFCVVIPPPNVTGDLHMGHALEHTLIDALIRRRRMQGHEALWLPGMDHAGIATQNAVEKQLAVDGKTRHDFGRDLFVQKVWDWKREFGGAIQGQMRRLGDSVDWSRDRFTLDEGLSRAVQTIFKRLFDDGLIYRAERIINWCPSCRTALSDIEVEHEDVDGELVSLRYGGTGPGDDSIVVATTRVETMLGDTAVAVHPDDQRYAHLVGRELELPIVGRRIPVVADEGADPAVGTGAVKVTPAHDPNDFAIGQRHGLPMPSIMDATGRIAGTGTRFDGMDRFEARAAVREELRAQGRVVAEKRPYRHAIGHCSRCDTVVEPRLSKQWFVRVEPLAKAAGDAVRDGRVLIHPQEQRPRWFAWVDHMHDWCISRQLWWGHRIPVWYGPDGETVCVGPDEQPPPGWRQDDDVLDTWFSSALWPFSTLGWPARTVDLERFYPTSVLVTGYDILFFWVARMMMFGLYAMGEPPFHVVALHGLVRDQHGKKMSKSRGNTVDPLAWIDRYGADALRFTLARGANPGSDQAISEEWVAGARNFANKLWNATRFALMNGAVTGAGLSAAAELTDADRWVLGRLRAVISEVDALLEDFQFGKAAEALYHFTWDEFCDWYLELAKVQLAEPQRAEPTRAVLGHVLDALLRLLHPFMPFVTEALWTALTGGESVTIAPWPSAGAVEPGGAGTAPDRVGADRVAADRVGAVQKLVTEIRRFRSDHGLNPGQRVAARLRGLDAADLDGFEAAVRVLARLAQPADGFAATAAFDVGLPAGPVTVELDTSGTLDVAAEQARLDKELAAARKELAGVEAKLANPDFVGKAPAEVVAKIRQRRSVALADLDRIEARLAALAAAAGRSSG